VSQENVEIVRRWLQAFGGDRDAFRSVTHPDIEWMPFEDNHTPTHGLEGAMQIRDGWLDAWDEPRVDIEEIRDAGDDDVLLAASVVGRGKASGVPVEVRLYGHFKVRDGKVVYFYEHLDHAEALKAVGLEE
jgi:ketosteroid isomerase-like protein